MDDKPETSSMANPNPDPETHQTYTSHHLTTPSGLSPEEFEELKQQVVDFHAYQLHSNQCSSLLAQRIHAPDHVVWSIVRRFDKPQTYKHFIKSCSVSDNFVMTVGSTRDVNVISGLPAATSTERLDILDDDRQVTGFSIIGGEHRLRNYRSVTTVQGFNREGRIWSVVLESYIVDMPEGNTEEDTRLFADTVVKLNLQKLASVAEGYARDGDSKSQRLSELQCNTWPLPPVGTLKVNVDAAIDKHRGKIGIGIVVRNSAGCLVLAKAVPKKSCTDVVVAEATAVLEGLKLATNLGWRSLIVASDSSTVVNLCSKKLFSLGDVGNIIHDIHLTLCDNPDFTISFAPRQTNVEAHKTAKWALSYNSSTTWNRLFPQWLQLPAPDVNINFSSQELTAVPPFS